MDKPEWYRACKNGDMTAIKRLVTRENVNTLLYKKWTPVFLVAAYEYPSCVRWMIVELNARASGLVLTYPPVDFIHTLPMDCFDILPYLKRAGADIDAVRHDHHNRRMTRLAIAIDHNTQHDHTRALIKHGAKLSNVHASVKVPDWVRTVVDSMERCRRVCVVLMGVRARSSVMAHRVDVHVMRMIVELVWDTRVNTQWHCNF